MEIAEIFLKNTFKVLPIWWLFLFVMFCLYAIIEKIKAKHNFKNEPLIFGKSGSGKVRCTVIPNTDNFNNSISEDKEQ